MMMMMGGPSSPMQSSSSYVASFNRGMGIGIGGNGSGGGVGGGGGGVGLGGSGSGVGSGGGGGGGHATRPPFGAITVSRTPSNILPSTPPMTMTSPPMTMAMTMGSSMSESTVTPQRVETEDTGKGWVSSKSYVLCPNFLVLSPMSYVLSST